MKKVFSIVGLMLADIIIIAFSLTLSILIKNDGVFTDYFSNLFFFVLVLHSGITLATNSIYNCYGNIWAHMGAIEMIKITISILTSYFVTLVLLFVQHNIFQNVRIELLGLIPVLSITVLLEVFLMSSVRFSYRIYKSFISRMKNIKSRELKRILIYGPSENYVYIIDRIIKDYSGNCKIIAILNDDIASSGMRVSGIDILYGDADILGEVLEKYDINEVVVAEKVKNKADLKKVYSTCQFSKCEVKLYSGIVYLTEEIFIKKGSLRDIKIEDLLGRTEIKLDNLGVKELIKGKVVFVTGGAGSIGSEICRQVLDFGCKLLIAFDIHENGLFELENELAKHYDHDRFVMKVGSIRDPKRFDYIFSKYSPHIIFHAAAHKHVPMMEVNPGEAIKNNVFGTNNVAIKAMEYKVEKFILISTDKAVNPTNIMGASKRIAELLLKELNKKKITKFAAVRFGNVLGSNGSVIPIFKKQIAAGGPVTVTHPEITRYFMTIPEAVTLVLQAGYMANGGELFELDMGEPVKIYDLACEMIRLSGYQPETDIKIEFSGLRKGEKLYEELNLEGEILGPTENEKIFLCMHNDVEEDFLEKVNELHKVVDADNINHIARSVKTIVKEYITSTFELHDPEEVETKIVLEY